MMFSLKIYKKSIPRYWLFLSLFKARSLHLIYIDDDSHSCNRNSSKEVFISNSNFVSHFSCFLCVSICNNDCIRIDWK